MLRKLLPPMLALLLLACVGCGNKGPPRAPIRIQPTAVRGLVLRQIGQGVVVSFVLPPSSEVGPAPKGPLRLHLLRMLSADSLRPGAVSDRYLLIQFRKHARTVAVATAEDLVRAAAGGRLRLVDPGPPASTESISRRYLYSVMVTADEGKESRLSVPHLIEVLREFAPPTDLGLETAEGEVRLSWKPGTGGGIGFNVYRWRAVDAGPPERPMNRTPIGGPEYVDTEFQYGETYVYSVRGLIVPDLPVRESAGSSERRVTPIDVYAPAAPAGVAVSAEGSVIKVYWFPNSETDLGGYRLYRRAGMEGEFALLGETGSAETAFVDGTARAGVRYHYVVTAVDAMTPPNESDRSEERSELIPKRDDALPAAVPDDVETDPDPGKR
ncbi:MAG: hypothetical protein O7A63_03465 [Acidobacteria bacterium]|nr:hypothetical protein [Acidobacteriota bacterium]